MEGDAVGDKMKPPWFPYGRERWRVVEPEENDGIRPEDVQWQMISIQ